MFRRKVNDWRAEFSELFGKHQELSENRRNILLSNYYFWLATHLISFNFFTGLLLLMNVSDPNIGLITMISFFGNMLQVFSPLLLERLERRKKLLITGRILSHIFSIIVIGIIPLIPSTDSLKLYLLFAVIFVNTVMNAFIAPGYQVWHIKSVPNDLRSRYFSFIQLTNNIIIYTVVLLSSQIVDAFKSNGNELFGLLFLRGIALVLAVLDVIYLIKVREYPVPSRKIQVRDVLLKPFQEKKYLVTVAVACIWSFSANIPGSYYSVYLLRELNISYSYINLTNMLSIPVMFLIMPIWRRRVDKTSWFRALYFSISLYVLHYAGLAFVTEKNLLLYPLTLVYAFAISPGINLVFSNLPFVNMPEENQTNMLGFYAAMNSFASFLGVSLGRQFITVTEGVTVQLMGISMGNKQLIVLLTGLLMTIGVLAIYRLAKRVERN